ncbi:hypothetical protein Cob_v000244 [Colletotrichum orbiculare MAFF 240422]|uniref:Uncharacterized protein n=1 Tax=Colletotrichum orbiculare (strain 104-T / ATCC 96160 / CBS 514.97 / LARS 414 / MAFF 240422) TaxID=1213857 RepID=A0A484G7P1_COLOR|nr:hypothetical protein Cob_v000244 [Colletotrichum orbiculare MAFF 240422]
MSPAYLRTTSQASPRLCSEGTEPQAWSSTPSIHGNHPGGQAFSPRSLGITRTCTYSQSLGKAVSLESH